MKKQYKLKEEFWDDTNFNDLIKIIVFSLMKAGMYIGENIYEILPEKYKKYFI